jgi:hypothetical protein
MSLNELSFDHLKVFFEFGGDKDAPETITRYFLPTGKKKAEFLETTHPPCSSLLSTPALLDETVALFKSALNMACTTATTTRVVTYSSARCLTKAIIYPHRRLIRVAILPQNAEDKLALNRLHRRIKKKLVVPFNSIEEAKLNHLSAAAASLFKIF